MAVTFAPLRPDGTPLIDGTHDYTVQQNNTALSFINTLADQWAITWPAEPPMTRTIPGQTDGRLLYQVVLDYIDANAGGWNAQTADIWDRIRIAVAAAYRIEGHTIDWR